MLVGESGIGHLMGLVFGWFFVVGAVSVSVFELFRWRRDEVTVTVTKPVDGVMTETTTTRAETWRDIAVGKAVALLFLVLGTFMFCGLVGIQLPNMERLAVVGAWSACAVGLLVGAGVVLRHRRDLVLWAHTEQPESSLTDAVLADGAGEALAGSIVTRVTRAAYRIPLGSYVVPALLVVFALMAVAEAVES